jgi:hypothetical protein
MFRFSIRDILWLTVVVGLGCAWWAERHHRTVGLITIGRGEDGSMIGLQPGYKAITKITADGSLESTIERDD